MTKTVVRSTWRWAALTLALLGMSAVAPASAGGQSVRLWDTITPLRGQADVARRKAWHAIDAAAAGKLRGDLVVESGGVSAAFASRLGAVLISSSAHPAVRQAEVRPTQLPGRQVTLAPPKVMVGKGGVAVQVGFRAGQAGTLPIAFTFRGDGIVGITPGGGTSGLVLTAPLEVAIVPSFVGEDLIYDPRAYPTAKTLALPSEHFLLGLLKGESGMLVMTWQEDMRSVGLGLSAPGKGIGAVSFAGAKGLSLAVLEAPGIWHREVLKPSFLERNVAISWKPPFPAVWLTQLYEDEVKTTFEFRDKREHTWRGGVGNYTYPTWFSGGKTMLSLGKKIPPEGEAIIYFLERNEDTPPRVVTPIDVVQRTLTGDVLTSILDVKGRETWYAERPNAVIGAATCATTDALKEIFDKGQEVEQQARVKGGVEDMYYYLEQMQAQDGRFSPFAKEMIAYFDAQQKAKPELAPYLRPMRATAEEMVTTYDESRDTIRDMSYAHELGDRTIALAAEKRPDNPQRMMDLKQDWTGMGGALEELARKEHTLTRKMYQQAGYLAATRPEAMPVAAEVRKRTRQCLEHPESYEIWANY